VATPCLLDIYVHLLLNSMFSSVLLTSDHMIIWNK